MQGLRMLRWSKTSVSGKTPAAHSSSIRVPLSEAGLRPSWCWLSPALPYSLVYVFCLSKDITTPRDFSKHPMMLRRHEWHFEIVETSQPMQRSPRRIVDALASNYHLTDVGTGASSSSTEFCPICVGLSQREVEDVPRPASSPPAHSTRRGCYYSSIHHASLHYLFVPNESLLVRE